MSKKVIGAIWILLIVLLSLTWVAYANSSDKGLGDKWDKVIAQFNLRTVTKLPPGIKPTKIDSPRELAQLLHDLNAILAKGQRPLVVTWNPEAEKAGGTHVVLSSGIEETYVPLHRWRLVDIVFRVYFNLWANVWVSGSGSFWEITNVHEWVGLTGVTAMTDLSNEYAYHHISFDRQSAYIYDRGTVNYYLVLKGVFKVYSANVALNITFKIK